MDPVKIDSAWDTLSSQSVSDDNGNVWNMAVVADRAKDLKPFEVPMQCLCINKTIGGMQIREFVAHMKNVLNANLDYPIILDEDGGIFDGRHRAAKALLDGRESIMAVRFESDPPPTKRGD